jgi:class 3 adenylate cyclase/TolB-like protein
MNDRLPRKLAAILYADVAGYSRLTGLDEDATHRTLSEYLDLVAHTINSHRGQVMHYAGDAVLAKFEAVIDAISGATEIQDKLQAQNHDLPNERRVQFRIGVNIGDVIEDRGDIYGDGVNVAARLEALAEPGGICISDAARTAIGNKLPFQYVFIGDQKVKNIVEPVRAYRMLKQDAPDSTILDAAGIEGPPTLKPLGKPSIAVKPFENLNGADDQDHIAYALSNGIVVALTLVPGLTLIGDESPGLQDTQRMSVSELINRFGVRYVLQGDVRKLGQRIRVNAQLMEVASSEYIWAERFDRDINDLGDLFDIQDEITEEIVTAMEVKLLAGEAARLVRKTFKNPKALASYLRGEELLFRATTRPEFSEVRHLLEDAIQLEPESPVGYATAALAYWIEVLYEYSDDPETSLGRAAELAKQAILREDVTGYGFMVLAHIYLQRREYDQALEAANRAVSDRPSCPVVYALKANMLNYLGESAKAIEYAEYAVRLAPVQPPFYAAVLPTAYYGCGRYEEAIGAAKAMAALDEQKIEPYLIMAASQAALGRINEARQVGLKIKTLDPEFKTASFAESQPYKETAELERLIAHLASAGLN